VSTSEAVSGQHTAKPWVFVARTYFVDFNRFTTEYGENKAVAKVKVTAVVESGDGHHRLSKK
jgi:hypothetical protein